MENKILGFFILNEILKKIIKSKEPNKKHFRDVTIQVHKTYI